MFTIDYMLITIHFTYCIISGVICSLLWWQGGNRLSVEGWTHPGCVSLRTTDGRDQVSQLPRATLVNYHKPGGLEGQIHFLPGLEDASLKPTAHSLSLCDSGSNHSCVSSFWC